MVRIRRTKAPKAISEDTPIGDLMVCQWRVMQGVREVRPGEIVRKTDPLVKEKPEAFSAAIRSVSAGQR